MYKINIYNKHEKVEINTTYAILTINKIHISPDKLETFCSEILFQKENMEFIFDKKIKSVSDENDMIDFFIPVTANDNAIEEYILNSMKRNVNFYSFFAEALLTVALKDIYNYDLTSAAVDINNTVIDGHTGADECLYDEKNEVLVLGEAKFYKNFHDGLNKIITDFTSENGFLNKLISFKKHCSNNIQSRSIILKKLNKTDIHLLTIEEFLSMNITYAGFVLHEHTGNLNKYVDNNFYDIYNISAEKISSNIEKCLNKKIKTNHNVLLIHLPINSKKDLINKIIEIAKKKRDDNLNGNKK